MPFSLMVCRGEGVPQLRVVTRYTPDERLDPRSRFLDEYPLKSKLRHIEACEDDEDQVYHKERA